MTDSSDGIRVVGICWDCDSDGIEVEMYRRWDGPKGGQQDVKLCDYCANSHRSSIITVNHTRHNLSQMFNVLEKKLKNATSSS